MKKIYTARYILPVAEQIIEEGGILVENGIILAVGNKSEVIKKNPDSELIDLGFSALLPGLINTHVHLELTSLGPRRSILKLAFPFWLLGLVVGTRIRTLRFFINSIKKGLSMLKRSGTTTAGHIATFIRNPLQLFNEAGIRGVIFLEAIGLKKMDAKKIIEALKNELAELENHKLITPAISPHAPYSVSEELFKSISEISRDKKIPLSIHVAESIDEIKLFKSNRGRFKRIFYPLLGLKKYSPGGRGKTPVKYLEETGILRENTMAVHCVHLHQEDIKILKERHTSVIHCPRSNYYLNVGRAPVKQLYESGINICLATDGLVSNSTLSLWDEARFLKNENPWLDSESILRMMTINPARALGMEERIGSLSAGKFADFIAVDITGYQGGNIYDFLIQNTTEEKIKGVWVGGEDVLNYCADGAPEGDGG